MLIQAKYESVRGAMRVGDVIAFSGTGFLSGAIKFFTRNPVSHVGVVLETRDELSERRVDLMESTTLDGINGVQRTHLSERLKTYGGLAWWLPLSAATRESLCMNSFLNCLFTCQGRPYDYKAIAHFAFDVLHLWAQAESASRLFCSELVALSLKAGGVLPITMNTSEIRPVDLVELTIFSNNHIQIKGKPTAITGYCTHNPNAWKN